MFTTGSKLFLGATVLSLIATLVYGYGVGGKLGVLGLISVTVAFAFLTGMNFWVRDSNVSAMDTAGIETCAAATAPPSNSMWPLVAGLGLALLPVGLVVGYAIVWIAVILLLVATAEWMVLNWSDRASADAEYNTQVRRHIMHPFELPIAGAIGLGAVIFSFSRIMLYKPGTTGMVLFGGIAAGVLLFGALIAAQRNVGPSLVAAVCSIGGVGLLAAGIVTAIDGGHHIERHEIIGDAGTCAEEHTEADEKATRAIAAKANLAATITLKDGQLSAEVLGIPGSPDPVTLLRGNDNFVKFRNLDGGDFRLVAYLGDEVANAGADNEVRTPDIVCTQAVSAGGTQFVVIKPPRPSWSAAPDEPFEFTVPGVESAVLAIEVP